MGLKTFLFILAFSAEAKAKDHAPAYPRGTQVVCFECVDEHLKNPEIIRATFIDGQPTEQKVPAGKFILRAVACH